MISERLTDKLGSIFYVSIMGTGVYYLLTHTKEDPNVAIAVIVAVGFDILAGIELTLREIKKKLP